MNLQKDMERFFVKTKRQKEIVDLTDKVNFFLEKSKIKNGIVSLFVTHTTCCLTTADLDPGTDQDMLEAIEKIFPKGNYRHPHNPSHVGDHIMSSIIGPSLAMPIENGKLVLGTWQRVILIELSGPREREIVLEFIQADK
jgi:secondary thiamine-phosphate synthase enzyme